MAERTTKIIEVIKEKIGRPNQSSPSPFTNWLQPVAKEAEYGSLTFEYTVRKEMINPVEILHGGVVAGIIDDMMGATVYSMELPGQYVTVNLDVSFFAMAKLGDIIQARTRMLKLGKNIINMECEIWNPAKERMIAKGNANLMRVDV
ncbi:MAG: PaaI family thioesterase [Bacteroidales bacterium]|nr:PaaI family thioesterase [Bacteroidales bacterium]